MSNDVKCSDSSESRRWATLVLGSAALAALSWGLPLPSRFGDLLRAGAAQSAAGGPAGAAALVIASCLVWPLLVWGCAVLLLGAATRLPGGAGRYAVRALRRLLPAALRPLLVAGLGVSIGVGTIACGTTDSTAAQSIGAESIGGATSSARVAAPAGDAAARADVAGRAAAGAAARLAVRGGSGPDHRRHDPAGARLAGRKRSSVRERHGRVRRPPGPSGPRRAAAAPHRAASRSAAAAHGRTPLRGPVLVRPGDTLWAIAAAHLPAGADAAQIDHAWRAWYAANAGVIGPDPDLILPGQHLLPPITKDA